MGHILKNTFQNFLDDRCPRLAAAIAYYAIFSLPAILILSIMIAGMFLGKQAAQGQIEQALSRYVGARVAEVTQTILKNAQFSDGRSLATLISIGALCFGATGAFLQVQRALNDIWRVAPAPKASSIRRFIVKRLWALLIVVAIGVLALLSVGLTFVVGTMSDQIARMTGGAISGPMVNWLNLVVTFVLLVFFIALIYKVLPDAEIAWRDVWLGAIATSLLYILSKFLFGLYLQHGNPGNAYGAAGSVVVLLLWVYVSALIFMAGAEFTMNWAAAHNHGIRPSDGAIHIPRRPTAPHSDPPPHAGQPSEDLSS